MNCSWQRGKREKRKGREKERERIWSLDREERMVKEEENSVENAETFNDLVLVMIRPRYSLSIRLELVDDGKDSDSGHLKNWTRMFYCPTSSRAKE